MNANSAHQVVAPSAATPTEKSLWFYLRTALSLAVLLLVVGAGMVLIVLPKVAGAIPRAVLTQSMEPTLPPGTLIVVRPVEPNQVAVGDVVTYQIESGKPDVITHRVVAIAFTPSGTRTFTLKGDNNAVADADPVKEVQIVGRLWYSVPVIGYASLWLNGDARGVIVPVLAGLLFAFAAYMFISGLVGAVRERRRLAVQGADATGVPRREAPLATGLNGAIPIGAERTPLAHPLRSTPVSRARVVVRVAVGLVFTVAACLVVTSAIGIARRGRFSRD